MTESREKVPCTEKKMPMRRQRMLYGDCAQMNSKPEENQKKTLTLTHFSIVHKVSML